MDSTFFNSLISLTDYAILIIYTYIYMTYNMYWGYDLFKHHLILKVSFLDFEVFEEY